MNIAVNPIPSKQGNLTAANSDSSVEAFRKKVALFESYITSRTSSSLTENVSAVQSCSENLKSSKNLNGKNLTVVESPALGRAIVTVKDNYKYRLSEIESKVKNSYTFYFPPEGSIAAEKSKTLNTQGTQYRGIPEPDYTDYSSLTPENSSPPNLKSAPTGTSMAVNSTQDQKEATETPPPLPTTPLPQQQERFAGEAFDKIEDISGAPISENTFAENKPLTEEISDLSLKKWNSDESGIYMGSDGSVSDNQAEQEFDLSHSEIEWDDAADIGTKEHVDSTDYDVLFSNKSSFNESGIKRSQQIHQEIEEILTELSRLN